MTIYITELITGLLVIAGLFIWGEREVMKKLTFEIRSPAHQQKRYSRSTANPSRPNQTNRSNHSGTQPQLRPKQEAMGLLR